MANQELGLLGTGGVKQEIPPAERFSAGANGSGMQCFQLLDERQDRRGIVRVEMERPSPDAKKEGEKLLRRKMTLNPMNSSACFPAMWTI